MTEVSSKPRSRRWSAMRRCVLIRDVVEVGAEPVSVDRWRVAEHREDGVSGHESMTAHRSQLSDGRPVASDDESLSMIEAAHDLTAVVAKLALCDCVRHTHNVARSATLWQPARDIGSSALPAAPSPLCGEAFCGTSPGSGAAPAHLNVLGAVASRTPQIVVGLHAATSLAAQRAAPHTSDQVLHATARSRTVSTGIASVRTLRTASRAADLGGIELIPCAHGHDPSTDGQRTRRPSRARRGRGHLDAGGGQARRARVRCQGRAP